VTDTLLSNACSGLGCATPAEIGYAADAGTLNESKRGFSMRGEKIYEYDLDVTGLTDYGVSLEAILTGKEKVPPQGLRIDVAFEGRAQGRLAGQVRGVDYLRLRADGRVDLDIRATIETGDGRRIALSADAAQEDESRCIREPTSADVPIARTLIVDANTNLGGINGRRLCLVTE
jgi:hypothetical protein